MNPTTTSNRQRRYAPPAVLAFLGLLATIAFAASPATAHHGPDNIFPTANTASSCQEGPNLCQADSATHTVYIEQLGPIMTRATTLALDNSFSFSDLTIVYHDSTQVTYSGSWETDVIYVNRNSLPESTWGRAECDDKVNDLQCDQFYVLYHADKIDAEGLNGSEARKLACHETGHTVGLTHGANADPTMNNTDSNLGCMRSGRSESYLLGSHNINQINSLY